MGHTVQAMGRERVGQNEVAVARLKPELTMTAESKQPALATCLFKLTWLVLGADRAPRSHC